VTPRRLDRFEQRCWWVSTGLVWRMSPPDITEAPLYLLIFMARRPR
jgi:hypothetical protein